MVPRSLQEDLLRIPGVEGAEVEGTGEQPAGLRIRIAAGADQGAVGSAIRRVLTEHGLGTDTRLPGEGSPGDPDGPEVVPSAAADEVTAREDVETEVEADNGVVAVLDDHEIDTPVIDLTDEEDLADTVSEDPSLSTEAETSEDEPSSDSMDSSVEPDAEPMDVPLDPHGDTPQAPESPDEPASVERKATVAPPQPVQMPPSGGWARIESVGVEEGRDGILVTVSSSDGEAVRQIASSSEGGVEAAVVKATARLADPEAPDPVVVDIEDRRISGVDIVMIVLDADGVISAGSSVVAAGRSFALGRATWAALSL